MQERRLVPRFSIDCPVAVYAPDGRRFDARATDISSAGVGMAMSRAAVVALAQGGAVLTVGDPFALALPSADAATAWIRLSCRAQQVRRLSQDQYHVAALFSTLDEASTEVVSGLLASARQSI